MESNEKGESDCLFLNLLRFEIQAGSLSLGFMLIIAPLHSKLFIFSNILEPV